MEREGAFSENVPWDRMFFGITSLCFLDGTLNWEGWSHVHMFVKAIQNYPGSRSACAPATPLSLARPTCLDVLVDTDDR